MKKIITTVCLVAFILVSFTSICSAKKSKKVLPPPPTTTQFVTVLPNSTVAVVWVMENSTQRIKEDSQIKFYQWIGEEASLGNLLMILEAFEAEALYEELGLMINGSNVAE